MMPCPENNNVIIRKNSVDKTQAKLTVLPTWMMLQLDKWLSDKPTGMAVITIEVHANQGGIGGISRGFAIKEGM